jgi:hypothetical protein
MQLLESQALTNSESRSTLAFTATSGWGYPEWDRFISFDGRQIFHIGNPCETCEFFFKRVSDRSVSSFEIDRTRLALEAGLNSIDETAMAFSEVIPNGDYVVALFVAHLRQAGSSVMPDYFSHEQRLAWPEYDRDETEIPTCTSYFRGESRQVGDQQMLFEFFVPLYDIGMLNRNRVDHYKQILLAGHRPTAIALSVLDVKSSMSYPRDNAGAEIEPEFPTHWCFANYLLDGHHKMMASHETGKPISVLSFISRDASWEQVDELMTTYTAMTPP